MYDVKTTSFTPTPTFNQVFLALEIQRERYLYYTMASRLLLVRSARTALFSTTRPFSTSTTRFGTNERGHPNVDEHRKLQKEKPLNPHMTNTTSTIANEMPSVGKDKAPPELISSVEGKYAPKDSVPENTERMTGGTQKQPEGPVAGELKVGEIEGGSFKVEPLRRTGEDANTTRARLLCPSLYPTSTQ
jgi:hypothetical protein